MRALVQRVRAGSVAIDGKITGKIGRGVVVLLGVTHDDQEGDAEFLAAKCVNLRIFPDDDGNMNRSLLEAGGEALIVSQFTLYADTRKGRRPSFIDAARPHVSEPLYRRFVELVAGHGVKVATGEFGAMMLVQIENDGPVTIMLESR